MLKIIADDKIPFLKGVLEPFADIRYLKGSEIDSEAVIEADALLIRTRTKCTEDLLEGSPVKFIGTATIGFDHIDTQYCDRKGITWVNAPGCNSSSVQQYIAAALMKISHEFRKPLKGCTLGIVGVGNVGSKVARFGEIMGMKVLLNDPPRARIEGTEGFTDLDTLLRSSDFVTAHVPLNIVGKDATWHMFDNKAFRKMREGAWFINSSRGEVAETAALKKALAGKKMAGAVVDVWENEPDIDTDLMHLTFLSTPHIAGYSTDGKANGTAMVVNSLASFFGLPLQNWYPPALPSPEEELISLNCAGLSIDEVARKAVFHTYNIDTDNIRLRFSPSDFEKIRGDYPVRREFPAFTIRLTNGTSEHRNLFRDLGFKFAE